MFLRPEQMIQDPETGQQLIYDAFIRDGWLYMVSTYYHYMDDPHTIVVDGRQAEAVGVNEYEPVVYYRVRVDGVPTTVSINGDVYNFPYSLDVLGSGTPSCLSIATLFKHDYTFIPDMLQWYRSQGATAFYLYFNGPELPPGLPQSPDVHYRLWNFRYWNPGSNYKDPETGWVHAAQTAFLTMVRLRHLPDHTWTGLVDIDEVVVSVDGRPLIDALADVSAGYACVRIQNHWAFRAANRIIYSQESTGPVARTKCFYRGTYDALCGIHGPKMAATDTVQNTTDFRMLHIVNQTHSNRISLIRDPKVTLMLPVKN
jgi:hypothetical protein